MVAVGDKDLLVGHDALDFSGDGGIVNLPNAVIHVTVVDDVDNRRRFRRFIETSLDGSFGVVIQHEELPEVRLGVSRKLQAIELRASVRQLVSEDDLLLVRKGLRQTDEPLANQHLAAFGMLELLEVGVEGGRCILRQDAIADPRFEVRRGARVDIIRVVVTRLLTAFCQTNEIVGAGVVVFLLQIRRDLVIRLRDEVLDRPRLLGVAEGREGEDVRHKRL